MAASKSKSKKVTPQRLTEMAWAFAAPLMLQSAIENRVFDVLDKKAMTLEEIWAATGASARGIKALVEALAGLGLLHRKGKKFVLAPDVSAFLVHDKPGYIGGFLKHVTGQLISNWTHLPEAVRNGLPAQAVNQQKVGAEFFKIFVEDLFDLNYAGASALAGALARRFKSSARAPKPPCEILDVAAGSGVWGIAMAQQIPQARITAVDWPAVTPVTKKIAIRHKVADRLRTLDGDLQSVDFGSGYHVALLGHILHSEGETRSRRLLKKIYDSLAPGGIIAIAEFVPDDDRSGPPYPLIFALNMLIHTQDGDTFTFAQMSGWLKEIGFGQISQLPIPAPSPILLAVKPTSAKGRRSK